MRGLEGRQTGARVEFSVRCKTEKKFEQRGGGHGVMRRSGGFVAVGVGSD